MRGHDVGDRIEVNGTYYEARPETVVCNGCVGHRNPMCKAMPLGCSVKGIIWVAVALSDAVGTQPPTEQIKPPVSNPTGPHDCPSKAYKPVHGGYPDARPQKGVTD